MKSFINYVDIETAYALVEKSAKYQIDNPGRGFRNIFLHGKPSLGKSQIVREIAENNGWDFVDLRLAGVDETVVLGLPYVYEGKQYFSTPSWWPDGSKPMILMLDELKSAHNQTQVAAFRLILERTIQNGKRLPDNVVIVAAGNMQSDRTGARELTPTMASRFCMHLVIDPSTANQTFLNYAVRRGLDKNIIGYLEWKKEHTYFDTTDEAPVAVPRTWEFLSNNMMMYGKDEYTSSEFLRMVCATVGTSIGQDFVAYLENVKYLPDWKRIRNCDPDYSYSVPYNEPAIQFGVSTGLAIEILEYSKMYPDAMAGYAEICRQFPMEMRIVFFRTIRRNLAAAIKVIQHPEFSKMWKEIEGRVK